MADADLTQAEADALIAMEKHCLEINDWNFPGPGDPLAIPLISADRRESFILDITRGRVKMTKATYQNRARGSIVLIRLDIDGPPHRNPDGEEIPCPHVHIYREGAGTQWAKPIPADLYPDLSTLASLFQSFMEHCNITQPPQIQMGLF